MRKRAKPRDDGKRDPAYLAWIRRQPCALATYACTGGTHAHHATAGRGLGQKAHDHTAVPLCALHHEAFHAGRAPFDGGKEARAAFMRMTAAAYRVTYLLAR